MYSFTLPEKGYMKDKIYESFKVQKCFRSALTFEGYVENILPPEL